MARSSSTAGLVFGVRVPWSSSPNWFSMFRSTRSSIMASVSSLGSALRTAGVDVGHVSRSEWGQRPDRPWRRPGRAVADPTSAAARPTRCSPSTTFKPTRSKPSLFAGSTTTRRDASSMGNIILRQSTSGLSDEPLAKRVIGRVFPCRRRRGEGRSAGGMQRSQDGSDRAREAGDTGVHGACLPVMRASAREERWRISFTSRSSLRLFSIHSR